MINRFKYTNNNKRYYTLDYFYKQKFNKKVTKISLNGNFSCPNIDKTKKTGGCIYCSKSGSGDFAGDKNKDVVTQFYEQKEKLKNKWPDTLYIGYFQANTNTYAEIDVLKQKYEPILKLDNVVGLSIATRPDAITDECYDYLEELNKRTFLTVELGLQSIHEKTIKLINRGHTLKCFTECVENLRRRNINVVVHIIFGLPYETKVMMLDTIKYLNKLDIQGIKIHMLHIIKDTNLEKMYRVKPFPILTKDEYVDIVCDSIEILRDDIVINRITGDPVKEDLIEPAWLLKKFDVLNSIDKELEKRNTYQGFNKSILNRVLERYDYYVKTNSLVIDATIGNGNDTLILAKKASKGHVFGFDISSQAIENTKKLLEINNISNVTIFKTSHENMLNTLKDYKKKISLITFNLGYLPKHDKNITTKSKSTIKAIIDSYELIHNNGVILITVYPHHDEGKKEHIALNEFIKDKKYKIYHNNDNKEAPYLIELTK